MNLLVSITLIVMRTGIQRVRLGDVIKPVILYAVQGV